MSSPVEQDFELERLVEAAATGDRRAWEELWTRLEPRLLGLVRKTRLLAHRGPTPDAARDVIVAVMARLRGDGFRRLGVYLQARRKDPELTFMRWLMVLARRVTIDCLRADPDYVDRRRSKHAADSPGVWIEIQELPSEKSLSAGRPAMTNRVAARQILRYADVVLSDPQKRALEMWAEQASLDDIAGALALDGPAAAQRHVRAAVERLRRHFRERGR